MKIYVYRWPAGEDGSIVLRAIRSDGEHIAETGNIRTNLQELAARDLLSETLRRDHVGCKRIWVNDPKAHTILWSLINPTNSEEIEDELKEGQSLCELCMHARVCAAANNTNTIGAVISDCPEFAEESHEQS